MNPSQIGTSPGTLNLQVSEALGHQLRILTNQTRKGHPYLLQTASLLAGWKDVAQQERMSPFGHLYWAWRMFRESRDFDAVVTGWERSSLIFAVLQALLRHRRKCHVIIYTKWRVPQSRVGRWFRLCQYQFLSRLIDRFVPLSRRQAEIYASTWHIANKKFSVLPYHVTVDPGNFEVSDGGYIFAGGDDEKDYPTLIEAVRGLPCHIVIAALYRHHFKRLEIPNNVEILTASPSEYSQLLAASRLVVVPLLEGAVRGGEQSFLNAMRLGKPVIVLSECGADEYIRTGESGIVLKCGDVAGLRSALHEMLENPAYREKLAKNGKAVAETLTARRYCDGLIDIVSECVRSRKV